MTHDEATAAMKAEDAWVEKAARGWWDWGATMRKATGNGREWDQLDEDERALVRSRVRTALAPVVPDIQAQALEDAADRLHARTDGVNREGTKGWPERHREVYAHAIDEASDALREDAGRLTTTTGEPTT